MVDVDLAKEVIEYKNLTLPSNAEIMHHYFLLILLFIAYFLMNFKKIP